MSKRRDRPMQLPATVGWDWFGRIRSSGFLFALGVAFLVSGCHSAYVNATVSNHSSSTISVVQVEYPSASFGTQTIPPGQEYKYRFKVLGSGTVKITYTDEKRVEHKFVGPSLKEGDEGELRIVVGDGAPGWEMGHLHK